MEPVKSLEEDLAELRETYNSGKTRTQSWRRSQLEALLTLLKEKEEDIFEALKQDLGKHKAEAYRDEVRSRMAYCMLLLLFFLCIEQK